MNLKASHERWEWRLADTYRLGLNRKERRDRARATRGTSSPRMRAPIDKATLLMAMQLRERDHKYGSGLGSGGLQVAPSGLVDGYAVGERQDSLSETGGRQSNLRSVSDKGRVPGLR